MVYSMYDRMIVGGAMPVGETLLLEAIDPLKAPYFLTRREMGIFNVGGKGRVIAGDEVFELDYKEALYLGRGERDVHFASGSIGQGAFARCARLSAVQLPPEFAVVDSFTDAAPPANPSLNATAQIPV